MKQLSLRTTLSELSERAEKKVVDYGHILLTVFFIFAGTISFILSVIYLKEGPYWEVGVGFAVSFYTAGIITIVYHWLLITDISNLVVKNIIFNKEFLSTVIADEQTDRLLQYILEIKLKREMGRLVKSQIIDRIVKDQTDYMLYGFDFYITVSNPTPQYPDYFHVNFKEIVYETVVKQYVTFYATNSSRVWEILGRKEKDKQLGISEVYLLPTNVPDTNLVNDDNIKEFYKIILKVNDHTLESKYSIKRNRELAHLGIMMEDGEYCAEVCFDLFQFNHVKIGDKAQKYTEVHTYMHKDKNFFYVDLSYAFSTAHIHWDCIDTRIASVTYFSSIENLSEPRSMDPFNKKVSIVTHTPGLPGHFVMFVWRFNQLPQHLQNDDAIYHTD